MSEAEVVFEGLSDKNKRTIEKTIKFFSVNAKSTKRLGNARRSLIRLADFIEKDLTKISYDDYVSIGQAISMSELGTDARNLERDFVKRFIKENYSTWRTTFKDLKLFKMESKSDKDKIQAKDILTDDEVLRMVQATTDMQKQTLIVTADVSGMRPDELTHAKYCDVDFKSKTIYAFSGKTQKRRMIPINSALSHLERLKKETNARHDDLLFPSKNKKVLTIAGLNYIFKELATKANIHKRTNPYSFRHRRCSYWITRLSPKVYEMVAGHSLATGLKKYAHLSEDIVIKEMRERIYEVEELDDGTTNELVNEVKLLKKENVDLRSRLETMPVQVARHVIEIIRNPSLLKEFEKTKYMSKKN